MIGLLCPSDLAASTYSISLIFNTSPRTNLVIVVQLTRLMIIMTFLIPGDKIAAAVIAKNNTGKLITTSVIRIMMLSTTLPKYPAITPKSTPIIVEMSTAVNATDREILAPYISLLNISLPVPSVPRICSDDGSPYGWKLPSSSFGEINGSYGARSGANNATSIKKTNTTKPNTANLFLRNLFHAALSLKRFFVGCSISANSSCVGVGFRILLSTSPPSRHYSLYKVVSVYAN